MKRAVEGTISLKDVRDLLRRVESEYNVDVRIDLKPSPRDTTRFDWWVTVWSEPRTLARGRARAVHHLQHQWPSVKAKTLAGLFFALLWELEAILSDEQAGEERASATRQARMF
jgi:hypothetical protein